MDIEDENVCESTPELIEKVQLLNEKATIESFIAPINARWEMTRFRGRPSSFRLSNFSGDVFFTNLDWTVAGDVDWVNDYGRRSRDPFFVHYSEPADTLEVQFLIYTVVVNNARSPDSPVQINYDINTGRVMFVFRKNVPIPKDPNYGMRSGSYMSIP